MRLLTMSVLWLVLLFWAFNAPWLGCPAVIAIHTLVSGVLLMAGSESAFLHRRAMVSACIRREARLLRLLHGPGMLLLREVLLSAVLGLALTVGVLLLQPRDWSLFYGDLLLLALVVPRLAGAAGQSVRRQLRFAMGRHWAMLMSVAIIWTLIMLGHVFEPAADYLGFRWQEVVELGIRPPEVACGLVRVFAEGAATVQALALWALQNYARAVQSPTESTVVWIGFLGLALFPAVLAYAYSRLLVGTMARPWEMWQTMIADFREQRGEGEVDASDRPGGAEQRRR